MDVPFLAVIYFSAQALIELKKSSNKMILWNTPSPPNDSLRADQVDASGEGLVNGKTGCHLHFQIKPKDTPDSTQGQFNATNCQVTFEGPSKPDIRFRTSENNVVNCSWMAYLPGEYKIIVRYSGHQIVGSPFICKISESEQGSQILQAQLTKINCTGPGLQFGLINELNEVRVNGVNGMIGGLRVAMEGPGQGVISFRTNPDSSQNESLSMFYQVPNQGDYSLIVKFMDKHVHGSPFKITVK